MSSEHIVGVRRHALFCIWFASVVSAVSVLAAESSLTIISQGTQQSYSKVGPDLPFRIRQSGPSLLVLTLRQRLGPPGVAVTVSIFMDGRKLGTYVLDLPRDSGAVCMEEAEFIISVPRTVRLKVPPGNHSYEVSMTGPGGAIAARAAPPVTSLPPPSVSSGALTHQRGQDTTRRKEATRERVFGLSSSLSFGYDTNILQLSPSDITLFLTNRTYAPNNGLQRIDSKISSPDDYPIVFELEGTALGRLWGQRKTSVEMKGHSYVFPRNTIKTHGDAGISFEQEFSPGPDIRVSYVYQSLTYLRNLGYFDPKVAGTSFSFVTYRKAWFQMHTGGITIIQNISRVVSLDAGYSFGSTIFRDVFKERDSAIHTGMGGIRITPWTPLGMKVAYAYERSFARRDLPSTPRIEPDTSYGQSSAIAVMDLDLASLGPTLSLNGNGAIRFKNFTTGDSLDTLHYRREDVMTSVGVNFAYHITRKWALGLSYTFTRVKSDITPAAVPEETDEATSYREDSAFFTIAFTSPPFGPVVTHPHEGSLRNSYLYLNE